MKKSLTIAIFVLLAAAVLLMGIMEKTLSSIGGTPAVAAAYVLIGIILIVLYIKARKDSAEEKSKNENKKNTDVR